MDTGPLCSKWNCGSEFSGVMRHLKGDREQAEKLMYGHTKKVTYIKVINGDRNDTQ